MVNTQLLRVQTVHTKYRKYFRGFFNSRLLNFARNPRKLMCHKYFHFYSIFFHIFFIHEVTHGQTNKQTNKQTSHTVAGDSWLVDLIKIASVHEAEVGATVVHVEID